jgi:hypothetical protein
VSVAPLCGFGLQRGVGAETGSEFFGRLRLASPVGGSPSAWRHVLHILAPLLLETATAWEQEGLAPGEICPVSGAVAATCVPRRRWVFRDRATGYARAISGRLRPAKRALEPAKQRLATLPHNVQAEDGPGAQARAAACATAGPPWQEVGRAGR